MSQAVQDDPHGGAALVSAGPDPDQADALVIAIHGRGATARGILDLALAVNAPRVHWWAPQATGFSWYPNGFMSPIQANQPHLDSALRLIGTLIERAEEAGVSRDRVVLVGFSQGACLALEWTVRRGAGLGGVAAFSGGLIGPPGRSWEDGPALDDLRCFLGCSDVDPHIPLERVEESGQVL